MAYGDNVTGDSGKSEKVTVIALVAPPILLARLSDSTDPINQAYLSGKEAGAMVLAITAGTVDAPTAFSLRAAVGVAPTDAWVEVTTAAE